MDIEAFLSDFDLMPIFVTAIVLGMILCILDGVITVYRERTYTFYPYRVAFIIVACSLAWSFIYSKNQGWQPWPPLVGFVLAVDYLLLIIFLRHIEISKIDRRGI